MMANAYIIATMESVIFVHLQSPSIESNQFISKYRHDLQWIQHVYSKEWQVSLVCDLLYSTYLAN